MKSIFSRRSCCGLRRELEVEDLQFDAAAASKITRTPSGVSTRMRRGRSSTGLGRLSVVVRRGMLRSRGALREGCSAETFGTWINDAQDNDKHSAAEDCPYDTAPMLTVDHDGSRLQRLPRRIPDESPKKRVTIASALDSPCSNEIYTNSRRNTNEIRRL